jgi:hypothetical protein
MVIPTEIAMELCDRIDQIQTNFHSQVKQISKNKDNHLTQVVVDHKKEHVAQESKKTNSNLQVKHQAPLLQGIAIQCNQKLQLEDQALGIKLKKSLSKKTK